MKNYFALGLITAVALSSCQKEGTAAHKQKCEAFYASIEECGNKTSLDESLNIRWKLGDQVSIFQGSTINEKWQVSDASDGQTSATLNQAEFPGFVAGGEIANNVAYYPYASSNMVAYAQKASNESISAGSVYVISTTLPATQNYAAGSFGNGAFPMVAVTSSVSDNKLKFKNVLGALELQLKGTATITSISIYGNNNEILCGPAKVTASVDNTPSINMIEASAKTITLDCGAGVQLNNTTATSFIIALPPITMTGGFTVTVTDNGGNQMEKSTVKSRTIRRSELHTMPEFDFN